MSPHGTFKSSHPALNRPATAAQPSPRSSESSKAVPFFWLNLNTETLKKKKIIQIYTLFFFFLTPLALKKARDLANHHVHYIPSLMDRVMIVVIIYPYISCNEI